ncbi:MAG: TIGR03620 family F420-dependent LLM class oxidoreductase [Acidimicrobiales bacterium]
MTFPITGTGIWSPALRYSDPGVAADLAAELEVLGYAALWIPDIGGDVFGPLENLLSATTTATIATGILNLWMHEPEETAAQHARLTSSYGRRFLVGIGVSHAPLIDATEPGRYRRPLARTREFLDGLDGAPTPLPVDDRVLAALGPKMLELAGDRAAGAHPYLVTPGHTAAARQALGAGKLVLPEQGVVLETDPDRARMIARTHLAGYLGLPNYSNNWKRFGFTDDDVGDGGSDRLVDALVAWGDEEAIAARVQEHRDAGADHVCLQVLSEDASVLPIDDCRRLAAAVTA